MLSNLVTLVGLAVFVAAVAILASPAWALIPVSIILVVVGMNLDA
jgi:hypothetical protein